MNEAIQLGGGRALEEKLASLMGHAHLTETERELVRILAGHRGAASPIKSAAILDALRMRRGESGRRWVNATVESLVVIHGLPVGASRMYPQGFFLIETQADLDIAVQAHWSQMYGHLRRLRHLASKLQVARLFGQAMFKFDSEEAA